MLVLKILRWVGSNFVQDAFYAELQRPIKADEETLFYGLARSKEISFPRISTTDPGKNTRSQRRLRRILMCGDLNAS